MNPIQIGPIPGRLATLLAAAVRAPSGDNTQPWRFEVDSGAGVIGVEIDATRDPSPMNVGQRMARIGAGAALENMLRTAKHNGWKTELELRGGSCILRLDDAHGLAGELDPIIAPRVTNRRLYDARPVPAETLAQLTQATPDLESVATHWLTQRERLLEISALIGRADALMFGYGSMRRAFLSKVRFDAPAAEPVTEGLSLASLELSVAERLALRMMPYVPDSVLKLTGALRGLAAKARQLVDSSSGLCVIVAPDQSEATDWLVGRAMQRAWLALTAQGLAAQPMMSLLVLENAWDHGDPERRAALGPDRLTALREDLRKLVPEIGGRRPAFLLRFGFAPLPSGRTGRLPFELVTSSTTLPG